MNDKRTPLMNGTQLITDCGDIFTITNDHIGWGGNSIIYPATKTGSNRKFIIKECFPVTAPYTYIRNSKNGIIEAEDSENLAAITYLKKSRLSLEKECVLGQEIANYSGRVIVPWEKLLFTNIIFNGQAYPIEDNSFIVMEQINQKGFFLAELIKESAHKKSFWNLLPTGGLPHLYTICQIIEEVLKALDDVHKSGYIFGDIQEGNLFFMNPRIELGDIGVGYLLDFGCARKLNADSLTEEISEEDIFSTDGYTAPEIRLNNNGHLRLSPSADIYSVGCLMLYLIKGLDKRQSIYSRFVLSSSRNIFVSTRELSGRGGTSNIAEYINTILKRALSNSPEDRYQSAYDMLQVIIELKVYCQSAMKRNPSFSDSDDLSLIKSNTRKEILDTVLQLSQGSDNDARKLDSISRLIKYISNLYFSTISIKKSFRIQVKRNRNANIKISDSEDVNVEDNVANE